MPMSGLHDQVLSLGSAGFHNHGDVHAVVVDVVQKLIELCICAVLFVAKTAHILKRKPHVMFLRRFSAL